MIEARPLDEQEMHRFYGRYVLQPIKGYAGRDGFRTVIVGGLFIGLDNKVWGFIDARPAYRRGIIYRYMKRILEEAAADGIPAIYVARDASLETSERLLSRSGFTKTDDIIDGHEIWAWRNTEVQNG